MKISKIIIGVVVMSFAFVTMAHTQGKSHTQEIKPAEIKKVMQRVADWQIKHFDEPYSRKKPHHPLGWHNGALYVGMVKWAQMSGDSQYYSWLKAIGDKYEWKMHRIQKGKYFAEI